MTRRIPGTPIRASERARMYKERDDRDRSGDWGIREALVSLGFQVGFSLLAAIGIGVGSGSLWWMAGLIAARRGSTPARAVRSGCSNQAREI